MRHALLCLLLLTAACSDPGPAEVDEPAPEPVAEAPAEEADPSEPPAAEPAEEPEPEPAHVAPVPLRGAVGGECTVADPIVLAEVTRGQRVRATHDGRRGLLAYDIDDENIGVVVLDAEGAAVGEAQTHPMPGARSLFGVASVSGHFLVLTSERTSTHARVLSADGAAVGEPTPVEVNDSFSYSRARGAAADRYIVGVGSSVEGERTHVYSFLIDAAGALELLDQELSTDQSEWIGVAVEGARWAVLSFAHERSTLWTGGAEPVGTGLHDAFTRVAFDDEDLVVLASRQFANFGYVVRVAPDGTTGEHVDVPRREAMPPPFDQRVYARLENGSLVREDARDVRIGAPLRFPSPRPGDRRSSSVAFDGTRFIVGWPTRRDVRMTSVRCAAP